MVSHFSCPGRKRLYHILSNEPIHRIYKETDEKWQTFQKMPIFDSPPLHPILQTTFLILLRRRRRSLPLPLPLPLRLVAGSGQPSQQTRLGTTPSPPSPLAPLGLLSPPPHRGSRPAPKFPLFEGRGEGGKWRHGFSSKTWGNIRMNGGMRNGS